MNASEFSSETQGEAWSGQGVHASKHKGPEGLTNSQSKAAPGIAEVQPIWGAFERAIPTTHWRGPRWLLKSSIPAQGAQGLSESIQLGIDLLVRRQSKNEPWKELLVVKKATG